MQRKSISPLICTAVLLGVIGVSVIGLMTVHIGVQADTNSRVPLHGHISPLLRRAQLIQGMNQNQSLHVSLTLQLQNRPYLTQLLHAIYDPHSPQYHHYLKPAQFRQLFTPSQAQVQTVTQFLQQQGLHVSNVASNHLLIDATGNVSQVQQAFSTQINMYKAGPRTFYANATEPSIPAALGTLVASVDGLDDSLQFFPYIQSMHALPKNAVTSRLHLQKGSTNGPASTGFAPADLANAYDAQPLQNAGIQGDNQTIAIFALDGYNASDINQYFSTYNLGTPHISNVLVDNVSGAAGQQAVEDELDIEVAGAIAPHANIMVYEGPNNTQGINDTYNKIVNDNLAQIITTSWGTCEDVILPSELQTLDTIFTQAAAQGMSLFAASGDSGAYDCRDTNLAVDIPAGDPNVTGVGGTSLQLNNGAYSSESAWSNVKDILHGVKGGGGGGGISSVYNQPGWQTGNGVQNTFSNGYREVPDVSAEADPATGYVVYCTATNASCPATGWLSVGGTSGASPLWAGATALINQYLQSQNANTLGSANPVLYSLFNNQQSYPPFHDITTGNNLFYPATAGYDMATGLGSPDIYNIARDLAPTSAILAQDTFQRPDQTYWGTASNGQNWSADASSNTNFSISGNAGQVSNANNVSYNAILGPTSTNAEVLVTGSISQFNNTNFGAVLRWTDGNDWYKAYIDGSNLVLQKRVNGAYTRLGSTPFAAKGGKVYTIRFMVSGSTLSARVWSSDSKEPSSWMLTTTDTSLTSGYSGLRMLIQSGITARFTSFTVTAV